MINVGRLFAWFGLLIETVYPCSSTVQVTYPSTGVVVDGAIGVGTAAGELIFFG